MKFDKTPVRGGGAAGADVVRGAGRGAAEIHHHRHRRRHRRLLRGRRRDLPADEQEPRANRPALLGRIDRRLGVQRQHHQGGRARFRHGAVRRAVSTPTRATARSRAGRSRPARRVLGASGAVHGAGAQGSRRDQVRRLQGQALQRRQSRLGHALVDGRAAQADGLDQCATSRSPPSSRPTSRAPRSATTRSTASSTASAIRRPPSRIRPPPAAPSWSR